MDDRDKLGASMTKTISESDIYLFAGITGDFNAVHINDMAAKEGVFRERIAHGILITGLISAVIGTKFPGEGTIYLEQDAKFLKPVKIGDTVTARVKLDEIINQSKGIVRLDTMVENQQSETVIAGYAVVKIPDGLNLKGVEKDGKQN